VPVRPGSEEYLNSEKYEVRPRTLDGPLLPLVARLNAARRENEALQWLDPLTVLETENEQLFAFLKRRGDNTVVVVVNLDPSREQEGVCVLPVSTGLPPAYAVRDLLTDSQFTWRIGRNYVRLGPGQSHVLTIGA
jgi:starch synthase (maltosyl-transferring)